MRIFIVLLLAASYVHAYSQAEIVITLDTTKKATIAYRQDKKDASYDKLNFTDGKGTLTLINKTKTADYAIVFTLTKESGKTEFKIASKNIPVKKGDADGAKIYKIDKSGKSEIANSDFTGSLAITVLDREGKVAGISPLVKADKPEEVKPVVAEQKPDEVKPGPKVGAEDPATKNKETGGAQNSYLSNYVRQEIRSRGYTYASSQNIVIDGKGVIHIFLDEELNPIYSYYPSMAKSNYDKFQFHVIGRRKFSYKFTSTGIFKEKSLSADLDDTKFPVVQAKSAAAPSDEDIIEIPSAIFSPYSDVFPFAITRYTGGKPDGVEVSRDVELINVSRVSLNVGIVSSWLRNPENISTFVKPGGDTTLVSDNPNVRGMLVAMLTFHLIPRNLTIPPRTFKERLGVSLGLGLAGKFGDNFFFGLNGEVTNGLFINAGVHFGQVNYPINYPKFDYGEQKFSGELVTKTKWAAAPYISVSIDAALFMKAFKNLLNENGSGGNN